MAVSNSESRSSASSRAEISGGPISADFSSGADKKLDASSVVGTVVAIAEDASAEVREVEVKESVAKYLHDIVHKSRQAASIERGISPRGALAFFRASQARALLQGRSYVSPEDIHALAGPVLAHRVQLTAEARYGGVSAEEVLATVAREVRVPT